MSDGAFSASSAEIAAISSMRLLVVCCSPPFSSLRCWPDCKITPQPPGPGLPEQAPSVWITTFGFSLKSSVLPEPIVAIRLHLPVESQLAQIFVRVLALDQSLAVGVEPVIGAGEQESERRTAGKRRQCGKLVRLKRPHALIGLEK